MSKNNVIYQEEVNLFILDLHGYLERTPLVTTEEGYDHLQEYIEQTFEKLWPTLYLGHFRNYN